MSPELAEKLVLTLGGLVVGLGGAIFVLAKDLSFLKGQLTELIRVVEAFKRVAEHVAILDKSHLKSQIDIAHYFEKLRALERKLKKSDDHANGAS
jgi:hypothetical protein